jgi:hypothetical protein
VHKTYYNTGGAEKCDDVVSKSKCSFYSTLLSKKAREIFTATKLKAFRSNVKSYFCGCETWNVTNRITMDLQSFANRSLRNIFMLFWPKATFCMPVTSQWHNGIPKSAQSVSAGK